MRAHFQPHLVDFLAFCCFLCGLLVFGHILACFKVPLLLPIDPPWREILYAPYMHHNGPICSTFFLSLDLFSISEHLKISLVCTNFY